MILATAVWVYVSVLSLAYGLALIAFLRRAWGLADEPPPIAIVCLIGLAVIGVLAGALSLFVPIGLFANVLLLLGALAAAWRIGPDFRYCLAAAHAGRRSVSPVVGLLAAGAVLVTLERATETPLVGDTGLYHGQAIRWIEELGVVPGLGNLHARFAIDSVWFVLEALFGFSSLGFGPLHALNGWLSLCLISFLFLGVNELLVGRRSASGWAKLILLACWLPLVAGFISSPTPDLAVTVVLWLAFLLAYDAAEDEGSIALHEWAPVLAVIATFAVLIKVSAAPAMLLTIPVLVGAWRSGKPRALLVAALIAAMVIPLELRQLVLSGYPLFPLPDLDPFDFDWQMPRAAVLNIAGWIRSWARMPGRRPEEVLQMQLWEWLPSWIERLRNADRVLLIAIPLAASVLGARRLLRGRFTRPTPRLWVDATLAAGVAYWFVLAPDPRFGLGFFPVLGAVLVARVLAPGLARLPAAAISMALGAVLVAEVGTLYRSHPAAIASLAVRVLRPAPYRVEPTEEAKGTNFTVLIPRRGDCCWYDPFPCTPYRPDANLERRGTGWGAGFRTTGSPH
ncbi:MAG TPA: hypothetical protein VLF14_09685 [Candidatus Binatia bacterium]|nr:hypothetical protein [Candidatus Binatia bacterium]